LATIAKQERVRLSERTKAGLAIARSRGKKIGRPHVFVDRSRVAALRAQGLSWAKIGARLGVGEGTVIRAARASAKTVSREASVSDCQVAAD